MSPTSELSWVSSSCPSPESGEPIPVAVAHAEAVVHRNVFATFTWFAERREVDRLAAPPFVNDRPVTAPAERRRPDPPVCDAC